MTGDPTRLEGGVQRRQVCSPLEMHAECDFAAPSEPQPPPRPVLKPSAEPRVSPPPQLPHRSLGILQKLKPNGVAHLHGLWWLSTSRGHRVPAPACQAPHDLWPLPTRSLPYSCPSPQGLLLAHSRPPSTPASGASARPAHALIPLVSAQRSSSREPSLPPVHNENPIPGSASPYLTGLRFLLLGTTGLP